jgi:signal transduction histidine kinase
VLINLVQNAAEAFSEGGTIKLRAAESRIALGGRMRDVLIIEVEDNGAGIPPEVQKRLFDPFFTTKQSGTGLGLPIAARIVERHAGALRFQTAVNRGTTFGVVLPVKP